MVVVKNMRNYKEADKSHQELEEEIIQLKERIKDLENERDILLALHRRDFEDM